MSANVGTLDRIVRLVLGLALIAAPFVLAAPQLADPTVRAVMIAVGAVLVLTAAFRFCLLYRILGVKTCSV